MKMEEAYQMSLKYGYHSMVLFIELVVMKKRFLNWEDDMAKIEYYLQDRFAKELNEEIHTAGEKRGYWGESAI